MNKIKKIKKSIRKLKQIEERLHCNMCGYDYPRSAIVISIGTCVGCIEK